MDKVERRYGAYELHILRPSKIIDIEGQRSLEKLDLFSEPVEIIQQDITFRTIPNQIVIAEKTYYNKHLYLSILDEDKGDEYYAFSGKGRYFDQKLIGKTGLFEADKHAKFVGLFPNDLISLSQLPDYEFIQSLGIIGPIKRIKYFERKNILKPKYHKKLEKQQYTKKDLEELKQYLIDHVFTKEEKTKTIQKIYTIAKAPYKSYMNLTTTLPKEKYAGTADCAEINTNESLNRAAKVLKKKLL